MSEDKFEENPNPFAKAVKNLEKDRESIIADEKLRKEKEKKAQEEEYAKRIIQAEEILRGDCLEAIEAIPPLELGNRGATTFSSEAFLWFSEPLVHFEITQYVNQKSWVASLEKEGLPISYDLDYLQEKEQAFRKLSGRTFTDDNLENVYNIIRTELGVVQMKIKTIDGVNFEIHWKRRD
jgi:hypothetical protein